MEEQHYFDFALLPIERGFLPVGVEVSDHHCPVIAGTRHHFLQRIEAHRVARGFMEFEFEAERAFAGVGVVVDAHHSVPGG